MRLVCTRLLFAIGSERYTPYIKERKAAGDITIANHILGKSQLSLAKYLLIAAKEDDPDLDVNNIEAFLKHILQRVDFTRDLHFYTRTTIDTLDYSGDGLNTGSKVAITVAGDIKRQLWTELPSWFDLPQPVTIIKMVMPGVLMVEVPKHINHKDIDNVISIIEYRLKEEEAELGGLPYGAL
jgi:4-hydroxy-3-polyprenylbenzoate decarboxylase